jgi:TATA-box binding protein (TBP) (component of TFIID and TFIIIB)
MTSLEDLDLFMVPIDPFLSIHDIPWPRPENHVIVVDYQTTFDFQQMVGLVPGMSFKKSRLSALTMRFWEPGHLSAPIAQVSDSGIAVFMAAKSEMTTRLFVHYFRAILNNLPTKKGKPRNGPMSVCNKVCSGYTDPLDVSRFESRDSTRIVKSTKSFSGVPYRVRLESGEVIPFSVFPTGKFIVANLDPQSAKVAFSYILPVLERNRDNGNAKPSADQTIEFVRKHLATRREGQCIIDLVREAIDNASQNVVTRRSILQSILNESGENTAKRTWRTTQMADLDRCFEDDGLGKMRRMG